MRIARFGIALVAAASSLLFNSCGDSHPTEPTVLSTRASSTAIQSVQVPQPLGSTRLYQFSGGASFWDSVPRGSLTLHGGGVLDHTNTYAIFWGTSWNTNPQFTRDKITSIQTFLAGFGGSSYANILTEYGTSNRSTYVTTVIDNSAAPTGDPGYAALISHVCGVLQAHGLAQDPNGFYAVYTTAKYQPTYVGYHTSGTCPFGAVVLHVALIFNTDSLNDFPDGVYRSNDAEELASVTAHELSETITDPDVRTGWFATNTLGEIGDKCAYIPIPTPYITLSNGSVFKVQSEWSNLAFSRKTGFANGNNEPGCILSSAPWPQATISGPRTVSQYQQVTYSVAPTGGTPPYTYFWHFSSSVPTFVLPTGTGQTFTTTLYGSPTGQQEALFALVTDAVGRSVTATYLITTSP